MSKNKYLTLDDGIEIQEYFSQRNDIQSDSQSDW